MAKRIVKNNKTLLNEYLIHLKESLKRFVLILFFIIFVAPVMYIFCLKYINPLLTPLMIQRSFQGHEINQSWIHAPQNMISAVIASEDNKFCQHNGFDWKALRIVFGDAIKGKKTAGASTISMQTSKNLFLLPTRSVLRKLLEAYYTVWLELILDKPRIIQLYLNIVEFGPGVYGVEAASQSYFSQKAKRLSRRQASQLAAVLPNPLNWTVNNQRKKVIIIQRRIHQLGYLLNCVK